jgi:hypothetical protein
MRCHALAAHAIATLAALAIATLAVPALAGPPVSYDVLAATGDPAPGTHGVFSSFRRCAIDASGDVAFEAFLPDGNGGLDWALYLFREGALRLVAREGAQAPGTPPGVRFAAGDLPSLDDAGVATFSGYLEQTWNVTAANDEGLWAYDPDLGVLSLLAREGQPAPGTGVFPSLSGHSRSAAGHVGLWADDESASWVRTPGGSLAALAVAGDPAPGALDGAVFGEIGFPRLDGSGGATFEALLAPSSDRALFGPDGAGGVTLRARTGEQAPAHRPAPSSTRSVPASRTKPETSPSSPSCWRARAAWRRPTTAGSGGRTAPPPGRSWRARGGVRPGRPAPPSRASARRSPSTRSVGSPSWASSRSASAA